MKKTAIFLLLFMLFVPGALAATIVSQWQTVVDQNDTREMAPILITSTSDGDITAEHGIRILLSPEAQILWDDAELTITGTARDNGKVNLNVVPEYAADYKSVYIPVMKDFEASDWLSIQGLTLRGYDEACNNQFLGLDLDGDGEANVSDINIYRVGQNIKIDFTDPYPIRNADYTRNADGSVTLTWDHSVDYDFDATIIDRHRVKNGFTQQATIYEGFTTSYTDKDLDGVTSATYYLISKDDSGNQGEAVTLAVDLTAPIEEPVVEEPVVEEPAEEPVVHESEVDEMSRLLNYYDVRYRIKCMPSGVAVPENSSTCLWARIDLIYAQGLTGEDKVAGLALSERDLELMTTRRKWPEMRYEDNCITATEPAGYCPALGKALDRISYFLD